MAKFILLNLVLSTMFPAAGAAVSEDLTVDCSFPGGNIVVDSIQEDTVYLRQDMRDTPGFWF